MDIHRYLAELSGCPDEHVFVGNTKMTCLRRDFGVYDNFPILLGADQETVRKDLRSSMFTVAPLRGGYMFHDIVRMDAEHTSYRFHDIERKVLLQVKAHGCLHSFDELHAAFQQENFNMCVMFHPFEGRDIIDIETARAMAESIEDVCNYAMGKKLAFCLPYSAPFADVEEDVDNSRIVYHNIDTSRLEDRR